MAMLGNGPKRSRSPSEVWNFVGFKLTHELSVIVGNDAETAVGKPAYFGRALDTERQRFGGAGWQGSLTVRITPSCRDPEL